VLVRGRQALADGDDARGSCLLGSALDIWRCSALVDVRLGQVLRVEVCRLEEDRLATWQQRIDAELRRTGTKRCSAS
jgi:hypothetical protein